jgi:ComF family protein
MLNWLYPITCQLCGEAAEASLCEACLQTLPRVPRPICLYCGAPVAGEQIDAYHCPACAGKLRPFELARSALLTDDRVMPLIHELKYHRGIHLAAAFTPLLHQLWEETPELVHYHQAALVPVPISPLHLRKRGYNQAEEIALPLAKSLGLKLIQPLVRQDTGIESQTYLSASARMKNALAAYAAKKEYQEGRRVLPDKLVLIDDVYTTGATVRACAAALKKLPGVQKVAVITLLRVSR